MLKILVPTDYSPEAKNASLYAWHFASYTNSSLVFYHAMPALIPVTDIPFENYYLDEQEETLMLKEMYQQLMQLHKLDPNAVKTEFRVSTHNVISQGIQQAFEDSGCDIVIMGTHGASGFRKVFLGSNTAHFISEAKVPIMAIPGDYKFEPIYHMVYASDLRQLGEELDILVPFAEVFQSVLEIFYFDYAGPDSEQLILDAENYIEAHHYNNIKLNIQRGYLQFSVAENIKRNLNTTNTQLLVMYRAAHSWLDRLLIGSNSQKMVMDPGIPILVMPKKESDSD